MKYKIKDFKGIVSNYDEKDLSLEALNDSVNYRLNRGFATVDFPKVTPLSSNSNYSEYPTQFLPELAEGWAWEKGIFGRLKGDPLSESSLDASTSILLLVSKSYSSGIYSRNIWIRKWTTSDDDKWMQMHKGGINSPSLYITESFYATDRDGDVILKLDDGVIKIYMPHDCFWVGQIHRNLYGITSSTISVNQIYIDRLVEPFDSNNLGTTGNVVAQQYANTNRRLGVRYDVSVEDTQDVVVDDNDVSVKYYDSINNSTGETLVNLTSDSPLLEDELLVINHRYRVIDKTSGEYLAPPVDDTNVGNFHLFFNAYAPYYGKKGLYLLINKSHYDDLLKFADDKVLSDRYNTVTNPQLSKFISIQGVYYMVSKEQFDDDNTTIGFVYIGAQEVGDVGFDNTKLHFTLLVTQVLDEKSEVIISTYGRDSNVTNPKYAIKLSNFYSVLDSNKRVTRTRVYLKFTDDADFTLVKDFDHLDSDQEDHTTFYITTNDLANGTLLASNIGILFDEDKPWEHVVINDIRHIASHADVSVALRYNDRDNVFYSIVGGGVLQDDLLYSQTTLEVRNGGNTSAVAVIGNALALVTTDTLYTINVDEVSGQLAFTINDSLPYGVDRITDIAESQGSLILHTSQGIYMTDGYNKEWVSEPINNIVKDNYSTGRIYYNPIKHIIYYFPSMSMAYYLFSFERAKWERYSLKNEAMVDFFFDLNGEEVFLTTIDAGGSLYNTSGIIYPTISYAYTLYTPEEPTELLPLTETFTNNTYDNSQWTLLANTGTFTITNDKLYTDIGPVSGTDYTPINDPSAANFTHKTPIKNQSFIVEANVRNDSASPCQFLIGAANADIAVGMAIGRLSAPIGGYIKVTDYFGTGNDFSVGYYMDDYETEGAYMKVRIVYNHTTKELKAYYFSNTEGLGWKQIPKSAMSYITEETALIATDGTITMDLTDIELYLGAFFARYGTVIGGSGEYIDYITINYGKASKLGL